MTGTDARAAIEAAGAAPVTPLDIAYDHACEDTIADVIGRSDELGDAVDGELTPGEIDELHQRLAAASTH